MNRSLIVLTACLLAGACSSGSGKATPNSPSTSTTAVHAVKVASQCTHLPTTKELDSYSMPPALGGTSFDFVRSHVYPPIYDADGYVVSDDHGTIINSTPAGIIRLSSGTAGNSAGVVALLGVGDFDGDKQRDVLVRVYKNGSTGQSYMVLGTVPVGEHVVADVGIRIRPPRTYKGTPAAWAPAPVGDQDGDGADDVGVGPMLYSGRELAANTSATIPPPFRTLPAPYVGVLQLGPSGPPTFVLLDVAPSGLQVLDDRSDRLLLNARPTDVANAITYGARAEGATANGHRIVQFAYSTRGGSSTWRWDLDAPCGT